MADVSVLATRLVEAEKVYHEWRLGTTVRSFRDQNGEVVEYSAQGMMALSSYIAALRAQIASAGKAIDTYRGPLRFTF